MYSHALWRLRKNQKKLKKERKRKKTSKSIRKSKKGKSLSQARRFRCGGGDDFPMVWARLTTIIKSNHHCPQPKESSYKLKEIQSSIGTFLRATENDKVIPAGLFSWVWQGCLEWDRLPLPVKRKKKSKKKMGKKTKQILNHVLTKYS